MIFLFVAASAGWTADSRFFLTNTYGDFEVDVSVMDVRSGKVAVSGPEESPAIAKWLRKHPLAGDAPKPAGVEVTTRTEIAAGGGVWKDNRWMRTSKAIVIYVLKRDGRDFDMRSHDGPCEAVELKWSPDGRRVAFVTKTMDGDMRSPASYVYDFASVVGPQIGIVFNGEDSKRALQISDTIETKLKPHVVSALIKSKSQKWTGRIVHGPGLDELAAQIGTATGLPVVRRDGAADITVDLTQPQL